MLYTACYFEPQNHHGLRLSISQSQPKHIVVDGAIECLKPPAALLWDFKGNQIEKTDYVIGYRNHVARHWNEVRGWLDELDPAQDITLLCWEHPGKFCHRNLVYNLVAKHRPDCIGGRDCAFHKGDLVHAWDGDKYVLARWQGQDLVGRHLCEYPSGKPMVPPPHLVRPLSQSNPEMLSNIKLVLSDLDHVIRACASNPGGFISYPEDQVLIPEAVDTLKALHQFYPELQVMGITNQGGVEWKYKSLEACITEQRYTMSLVNEALGVPLLSQVFFCPLFSGAYCQRLDAEGGDPQTYSLTPMSYRKPGPGMLLEAMKLAGADSTNTLYVGDRPEDEGAARAAGLPFVYVAEFFDWATALKQEAA